MRLHIIRLHCLIRNTTYHATPWLLETTNILMGTQWHLSYRAHSFRLAARTSCKPLIKLRRSLRSASGWRLHVEMWNILSIITSKTTKLLHWMWKIRTGKQVQSQAFSITLKSVHCLFRNDSSHLLLSQWEALKLKWKANCSCSMFCSSKRTFLPSLAIGWTVSRDKSCLDMITSQPLQKHL